MVMLSGLYWAVSQSQVKTCSGVMVLDCWLENKLTASAADRNTAPAVMATLDLFTVNGLFQGLKTATDLVSFRDSTFGGQDICNLLLKFDCQIPIRVGSS